MKRTSKIIPLVLAAVIALSGFSFNQSAVTLDADAYPLFRQAEASEVLKTLEADGQKAKTDYDGMPLAVRGFAQAVNTENRSLELVGTDGEGEKTIKCTFDMAMPEIAVNGAEIYVLGTARVTLIGTAHISIKAVDIVKGKAASSDDFFTADNTIVSGRTMTDITLGHNTLTGGQRVSLKIPASWSVVKEELENIEGSLYRLNELPDSRRTRPEQLYIFYFDNEEQLSDLNDRGRTVKIEEAIIKNILPDETIGFGKFPKKRSAYGMTINYYGTGYGGYNAEFAFINDADNGILCMLYIFKTSEHRRDILSIFPFIEFR